MKICFIGKYPPIEGGVSRESFWLTHALAWSGHEVHVVTNATEVETPYRLVLDQELKPLQIAKGNLHIHSTQTGSPPYIPHANPFVTKLAGLAHDVIHTFQCDLILAYYFEPYGMAAALVSSWSGVPYGLKHAGSDVGRLMQAPHLSTSYRHMIQNAAFICAPPQTHRAFLDLGVPNWNIFPLNVGLIPEHFFSPQGPKLDPVQYLKASLPRLDTDEFPDYRNHYSFGLDNPYNPHLPTIGIYGKVGERKGSYDLIQALGRLKADGVKFNFLALTQGKVDELELFRAHLERFQMMDCTWMLPFTAPWNVPQFIRSCTAICFLERDFSIQIHQPLVAREVLACGVALVLSTEIAEKQTYAGRPKHGSNLYLTQPTDQLHLAGTLADIIQNPEKAVQVGTNGYQQLHTRRSFEEAAQVINGLFQSICDRVQLKQSEDQLAALDSGLISLAKQTLDDASPGESQSPSSGFLSHSERQILDHIRSKCVMRMNAALKQPRKTRYESAYFFLLKHLPPEVVTAIYDDFYKAYGISDFENDLHSYRCFARTSESVLANQPMLQPYFKDLARYERARVTVKLTPGPLDSFWPTKAGLGTSNPAVEQHAVLKLPDTVAIEVFDFDVFAVWDALKFQQPLPNPTIEKQHIVFQNIPKSTAVKTYSIDEASYGLLMLADGKRTMAQIIEHLCIQHNDPDLQPQVEAAIHHLIQKELLTTA